MWYGYVLNFGDVTAPNLERPVIADCEMVDAEYLLTVELPDPDIPLKKAFTFTFSALHEPPLQIIEIISKKFPSAVLILYYEDPNCHPPTEGVLTWMYGKEIAHDTRPMMLSKYWPDKKLAMKLLRQEAQKSR